MSALVRESKSKPLRPQDKSKIVYKLAAPNALDEAAGRTANYSAFHQPVIRADTFRLPSEIGNGGWI